MKGQKLSYTSLLARFDIAHLAAPCQRSSFLQRRAMVAKGTRSFGCDSVARPCGSNGTSFVFSIGTMPGRTCLSTTQHHHSITSQQTGFSGCSPRRTTDVRSGHALSTTSTLFPNHSHINQPASTFENAAIQELPKNHLNGASLFSTQQAASPL